MSPNSPETRIGDLEQKVARLDQRLQDLVNEVNALSPLVVGQARLESGLGHLQEDLREANVLISHVRQSIKDREARAEIERREQLKDSRDSRRAMWAGAIALLGVVTATVVSIVTNAP